VDVRFSTDPNGFRGLSTSDLRGAYLIDNLFRPDEVPMTYSDIDRSIIGSAVPVSKSLSLLGTKKEMAAEHFAERREVGIVNVGSDGNVLVDGAEHALANRDALYVGRGVKEIVFHSVKAMDPAKFYFVSYPAHKEYPTTHVRFAETEATRLGSQADANVRTIHKYFHARGVQSCQLVMGVTVLEEGSVWNTMPPHTHQRRSEVYMYFDLDPDSLVVHFLGRPDQTRHIIVRNEQAVLSPSWSIHTGVGTRSYSFIWAMGGENQVFEDMDGLTPELLQ
jgi:4-deoxy-L-threo-5-hexosulose-uronate ketol-isomerase